ncbi:MAG: D-aminoacylase [Synergistaceae bacterium]|nr:D-aminoacylase [Synergistaceae bacterium]
MLDILIKNATVIDGSGAPAKEFDVGVKDGRIVLDVIGKRTKEVKDASGLVLCPGFIESHSHGDRSIGEYVPSFSKISQGVTTEITGQCGNTPFPVDPKFYNEFKSISSFASISNTIPFEKFTSFSSFLDFVNKQDLYLNQVFLIGHNTLRASVMGVENRKATPEELDLMKDRLSEAMKSGARGMSSGLIYVPGVYSDEEELVELCKIVKQYDGVYATHMRNEAEKVVEAVEESIRIAEKSGVKLVISHHKVCGKGNWGFSKNTLKLVEEANERGTSVLMDVYPYEACMTSLNICIPPWHFSDGMEELLKKLSDEKWREVIKNEMNSPENKYDNFYKNSGGFKGVFVASAPNTPDAQGMFIPDYANSIKKSDFDAYFDLLIENSGGGNGIFFAMDPLEVERIYMNKHTVVGSDGLPVSMEDKGHPRSWGTFIKTISHYALEKKLLSLEEAINKQTKKTADFWGLKDVGQIAEGLRADLLLLNLDELVDRASYEDSNLRADGLDSVYIAGELVYSQKELTGKKPGRVVKIKNI